MTRYAISGARSAVKIFLFPVAKRAGTVHGIYKPVKAKNACDSSDQQVLYTCLSGKKDRGESSPRPTYTNLLHSRFNPVHVYTRTHSREGRCGRDSQAAENPTRVLDRLLDFEHLLSCPPRVRGATCARIRPYTCNYFGQSVPVKSHASSYIYPKVNGHGIRCRFMIVWCLLVDALPSIFRML